MSSQADVSEKKSSLARQIRKSVLHGLPFIGVQLIITVMLFSQALSHLSLVVLGFLLVEVSVLMLANRIMPNERRYHALRAETNDFLKLVRRLNTTAIRMSRTEIPNYHREFEKIQQEMKCSVDRMAAVAGKTDAELAAVDPDVPVQGVQGGG